MKISFIVRNIFTLGFVFVVMGISITATTRAFTISPSSGQVATGATQNVQIVASNTAVNAATIRLTVANATISNYADGNGILGIGECTGSAKSTSTQVCVSVASTGGNFTTGQVLGSFTITKTGTAPATITADTGSQYVDNTAVSGVLATFTTAGTTTGGTTTGGTTTGGTTTGTTGGTTGQLPNTANATNPQAAVTLGLLVIALGLLVGVTIKVVRSNN